MRRLLVVEDSVILRYALCEWLRLEGHDVLEAASGDDAKAVLSSNLKIDLVITDVEMPGSMNGLELARYIRGAFPELPVIVVSGVWSPEGVQETGIAAFFRKPYDLETLSAHIATLLPCREATTGKQGSQKPCLPS